MKIKRRLRLSEGSVSSVCDTLAWIDRQWARCHTCIQVVMDEHIRSRGGLGPAFHCQDDDQSCSQVIM